MKTCILIVPVVCLYAITTAQEKPVISLSDSAAIHRHIYLSRYKAPGAPVLQNVPAIFHNNYYKTLGVACKAELKIEKATKVPFRFRLGSLQQTDYLEQKPNAPKPERQ